MKTVFSEDLIKEYCQEQIQCYAGKIKKTSTTWQFRCPICGDSKTNTSKMRGMYYIKTNSFHCFNENCNATGLFLLTYFTCKPFTEIKKDFINWARKHLNKPIQQIIQPVQPKKEKEEFNIPSNWILDTDEVKNFINNRQLNKAPFLPKNFKLYYDTLAKRIIIPWTRLGNEIKCYQSRAIYSYQQPKYLFSKGGAKDVFNIDKIDSNFPYIFLLEGALDAIYVKNGIAIGGTKPKEEQLQIIKDYWPLHTLVLMLDNQNKDEASKTAISKMIKQDIKQQIFFWPKNIVEKDVNEFICNNDVNYFIDEKFLTDNIFSGARALLLLSKNF